MVWGSIPKYPFGAMKKGDSVLIQVPSKYTPDQFLCLLSNVANQTAKRRGGKFSNRIVNGGVRVWCLKTPVYPVPTGWLKDGHEYNIESNVPLTRKNAKNPHNTSRTGEPRCPVCGTRWHKQPKGRAAEKLKRPPRAANDM